MMLPDLNQRNPCCDESTAPQGDVRWSAKRVMWLAFAGVLLGVTYQAGAAPEAARSIKQEFMAQTEKEEKSATAFDAELVTLSAALRAGNKDDAITYFAGVVRGSLPTAPGRTKTDRLFRSTTRTSTGEKQFTRAQFVDNLLAWLAEFRNIKDARLKAKEFHLSEDGTSARLLLKLDIRGRNESGARRWDRAVGTGTAVLLDGHWRLGRINLASLETLVATREIFSDVTVAAGLADLRPVKEHDTGMYFRDAAATADINGDGILDVAAVESPGGIRIHLGQGDGRFVEITESLDLPVRLWNGGLLLLDTDNDGDLDLFLSAPGQQVLLESRLIPDGKLAFVDVSDRLGLHRVAGVPMSVAAADINRDGYPDIFVTNYAAIDFISLTVRLHHDLDAYPDLLFVSRGDGTYEEAADVWGVADGRYGLAAHFADVDEDGLIDLLIANDFGGGTALYLNQGDHFIDVGPAWGLQFGTDMGLSMADVDNDGHLDLHVTRMSSSTGVRLIKRMPPATSTAGRELHAATAVPRQILAGNGVYRNTGEGRFDLLATFSASWAWGGGFIDIDNDGWMDLHMPNGYYSGSRMDDT